MACVVAARVAGLLQPLEWSALDSMLRHRPTEPSDPRIVIVGITEADIRAVGQYPIPDRTLAQLLQTIHRYQPRAIGLDLFRDAAVGQGRAELNQAFQQIPNLIGIESILSADVTHQVKPPPGLPPERVGFVDTLIDSDGKLRRSLLAVKISKQIYYSLSVRLAAEYLQSEGIALQYTSQPGATIQFGTVQIPRFQANTGGYVREQAGGNQTLIDFRRHPEPFPVVSLMAVIQGQVDAALMRDRIVLIGMTASNSSNDTFLSLATKGTLLSASIGATSYHYHLMYGVEHHAHVISQILSATLDQRSLLHSWDDIWDYGWIVVWGIGGIAIGLMLQSPWKTLAGITVGSVALVGLCFGLMIVGWWVPLVPTLLALWGAGLTTFFFDQRSKIRLEQRERILKQTYDAVHNGPLQTLAALLRSLGDEPVPVDQLSIQLQELNQELRSVYESMQQAVYADEQYMTTSIQELLYQVYESTLQRDLPGFSTIRTFIPPDFSSLEDQYLNADQKRGLCLFLQEALCNVGKHSVNAQRLDVICLCESQKYRLQITDDGKSSASPQFSVHRGRGTEQAEELARSLHGRFERRSRQPQGTVCELSWTVRQPFFSLKWVFQLKHKLSHLWN